MKFINTFFLTSALLMALSYGFIVSVDPYNKLGINVWNLETKAVDFPRANKFNQLEHTSHQYEAFILGSSAAHRYKTAEVERITGLKTYNYAVQSATPEDFLAIFNHIISVQKPKLVIISADFYGLNKNFPTDDMFYISPLKDYLGSTQKKKIENKIGIFNKTYFTLEALRDSFKVVWVNNFGKARHAYLEHGDYFNEKHSNVNVPINQFPSSPFVFDEKRIEYYKKIKLKADELGIRLVVFPAPFSFGHWKRIQDDPSMAKKLDEFKFILVDIFGPIEDFNNSSMDKYEDPRYFHDSTHPSAEFSTQILEIVLKK